VGWSGNPDSQHEPFDFDGIRQRPVTLTSEEVDGFYYGFCNGTLWPLYHDALVNPEYHRHTWKPYVAVNKRYAMEAADVLEPGDIAWVQDYQLQLVPQMLRELVSDVTIGFYLHIPFPPIEIFSRLPWRRQIIEGLLGSDVVAFQTRQSADNFARAVKRFTDAVFTGRRDLYWRGRPIHLQPAPIAIDPTDFDRLARSSDVRQRAAEIRAELGNVECLILGMDRLDYTKGIDLRLRAFADLLSREEQGSRRFALVQLAVPSREQVPAYQNLRIAIEQLVGRINGDYGEAGWSPVSYLYRTVPFEEIVALYVAADIMLVTPLRDGMNLVAKEYIASRVDNDGVLILSEFAGAAEQLRAALLVNPYDIGHVAATIERAAAMPRAERQARMVKLKRIVSRSDVFEWARDCLTTLEAV
jgi:alpha,alpha-trehalose-phosphate synthase [UDP-forming]